MHILWDEPKRQRNLEWHGLDFEDAKARFDFGSALIERSYPGKDGRARFTAIGPLDGDLVTIVFSLLGSERPPRSSRCAGQAAKKGGAMARPQRKRSEITEEEEAEIQRGIAADPDNPELTSEELARMRPAREVLPPEFFAAVEEMRRRGRPPLAAPKKLVSLRLDPDVIENFKATGRGWQSRINEVLKAAKL